MCNLGNKPTKRRDVMNKEQQIEELHDFILNNLYKGSTHLLAEKLYNAGYRKTFTSDLASDTQKAYKEGYEKGAEEMRLEAKKPIEKFIKQRERQAVKEFSEKLIKLVFDYLDVENAEQAEQLSLIDSTLTYDVILHAIDKLIKEEN